MKDGCLIPRSSPLYKILSDLADNARLVFFAGLPGTGKSLFINQLAHLAGRRVNLLQWDVARPVFEATPTGRTYPQVGGVTHGMIRIAAGRWARQAVAERRDGLLIGETPLIGQRFMELARPLSDSAEAVLTDPSTRFVIPVPSREVRRHAESERERRFENPQHPREKEDAPPDVMRDSYRQITSLTEYDPAAYSAFYRRLLRYRNVTVLDVSEVLPASESSAYRFHVPTTDLVPTPEEAERVLQQTQIEIDEPELRRRLEKWFEV